MIDDRLPSLGHDKPNDTADHGPKGDLRFFSFAREISGLAVDGGRLASRSNASEALNNIFNARVQICSFILLELS